MSPREARGGTERVKALRRREEGGDARASVRAEGGECGERGVIVRHEKGGGAAVPSEAGEGGDWDEESKRASAAGGRGNIRVRG
jgi:hypothetical protein